MNDQITLGNMLVGVIAVVGHVVNFTMTGRKVRRENQADADAKLLPVTNDIKAIQEKIVDFMPRAEIERADASVLRVAEKAGEDVVNLRIAHGRLEQAYEGVQRDVGEIKSLVKDQGRDTVARFDKLHDCLTTISRKVG